MKFNEFYNIIMEIPHGSFQEPGPEINGNNIIMVDYRIELWQGLELEMKTAFYDILSKLNEEQIILYARKYSSGYLISIVKNNEEFLLQEPSSGEYLPEPLKVVIELLKSNNVTIEEFINYLGPNSEHFLYYDSDYEPVDVF